jgi:predicted aldo/keto reductase-like oxidoreductase
VHDDVDTLFGRDAVLEGLEKARDEKLTRHIGITGHVNPSYLIDAIGRFDFATALVPINPIDTKYLSFTREFVPAAKERNVAVIAMKVFAGGSLLSGGQFTAAELLRYALSQDHVAIAVPGCEAVSHVEEAWDGLADFQPLTAELQRALEARAGEHKGRASEWYKERRD